jgi:hypothetical protein
MGQSEVEGVLIRPSQSLGVNPNCLIIGQEKRLGSAPGAEFTEGEMTCPSPSALNTIRVPDCRDRVCIGYDTESTSVKLYWMKTSEAWPEYSWMWNEVTCFDEEKPGRRNNSHWETYIGSVHQIEGGPGGGMWEWSVTATFRGPRFLGAITGREISREDAGHSLVECYERMLRFYGWHCPRT